MTTLTTTTYATWIEEGNRAGYVFIERDIRMAPSGATPHATLADAEAAAHVAANHMLHFNSALRRVEIATKAEAAAGYTITATLTQ